MADTRQARPRILVAGTREAIETLSALLEGRADVVAARSTPEALGVPVFLDMPQLTARHGAEVAGEILRQVVLGAGS